jgi:hypothetical protein
MLQRLLLSSILLWMVSILDLSAQCTVTIAANPANGCITQTAPIVLTATASGFPASATLTWTWLYSPPGSGAWTTIISAGTNVYSANVEGGYAVNVTDGNCVAAASFYVGTPIPGVGDNTFCQGSPFTAPHVQGTNLLWYTVPTGGVASSTMPSVNTATSGSATFYVTQTINGCESYRTPLTIDVVQNLPTPTVSAPAAVCTGDTLFISFTSSFHPINIYGPGAQTYTNGVPIYGAGPSDSGWYSYSVTNSNSCSSIPASFHLGVGSCQLPVWPGDANNDYITNNNDALYLALVLANTGYARNNASIAYTPQLSPDWPTAGPPAINHKHADCNGDGMISISDTLAIFQNYGLPHPKGVHSPKPKITTLPDLYFDLAGISFTPGTTVNIPIKLGSSSYPMMNIVGLAAQVKLNGISLIQPMAVSHPVSWLGTNVMKFAKPISNNQVDIAHARIDHTNASGYGTIGNVQLTIPSSATGDAVLYFDNVTIIDSTGAVLTAYNVVDDTIHIQPVGIHGVDAPSVYAELVPNPSKTECRVIFRSEKAVDYLVTVTDLTGKTLWKQSQVIDKGEQDVPLPVQQFSPGVYFVIVQQDDGTILRTMKWVKE